MSSFRIMLSSLRHFSLRNFVAFVGIVCLALAGIGYALRTREPALVIECDVAGTEVYAGPMRLGPTPLRLTHSAVATLRLGSPPPIGDTGVRLVDPSTGGTNAWFTPNGAGLLINAPGREGILLWLKPPADCDKGVRMQQTPWGEALYFEIGASSGGRLETKALRRDRPRARQPIIAWLETPASVSCKEPTFIAKLVLENIGATEWRPQTRAVRLEITTGSFSTIRTVSHERAYTATFDSLAPGAQETIELELPTPNVPAFYKLDGRVHRADDKQPYAEFVHEGWPVGMPASALKVVE